MGMNGERPESEARDSKQISTVVRRWQSESSDPLGGAVPQLRQMFASEDYMTAAVGDLQSQSFLSCKLKLWWVLKQLNNWLSFSVTVAKRSNCSELWTTDNIPTFLWWEAAVVLLHWQGDGLGYRSNVIGSLVS